MNTLRFLTAGESHGPCLTVIIEGLPAGLSIEPSEINTLLKRRQGGYGRGKRMEIEEDRCEIEGGVRMGKTLGSPVSIKIENKDWSNWKDKWDSVEPILVPRPGHADLPGAIKYGHSDIRNVLERSSARETAARCVVGSIAKRFLSIFEIDILGYLLAIGRIKTEERPENLDEIINSPFFCQDKAKEDEMKKEVDKAEEEGDSLGGIFEVRATGIPPGLGSYVHWDRRLDAKISFALMSIPAVKGIEIGSGFSAAERRGSALHDEILYDEEKGFYRKTNNAGGIEGGVSNGEAIIARCAMKPIPTLRNPLSSCHIITKEKTPAPIIRSDISAVPAASVVGEAMLAIVLADSFMERFGGDNLFLIKERFFREREKNFLPF
ncbi:MAG: chorismate synthase [bacterium]|nr:chorismate synthase [bacterium]